MGLFNQIIGSLAGNTQGGSSPLQSILGAVLANQQGGLSGILSQLEQAGLGSIAQSWVGNGPNQSISPDQLRSAFGEDRVQDMANQAGMAPHDFLSQLSQHLPRVVDHATPDGQVPDDEDTRSV